MKPADAIDACTNCGHWVRYGQSWINTPDGPVHETCPTNPGHGNAPVRLHRRERTIPGRRA